MIHALQL